MSEELALYTNGIEVWIAAGWGDLYTQLKDFHGTVETQSWAVLPSSTPITLSYSYDEWVYKPPRLPRHTTEMEKRGDFIVVTADASTWAKFSERGLLCSTQ